MKKYILLLFLGLNITLNAQEVCLNVPEVKQQLSNWCWAASSQCILWYYGNFSARQCDIAEYVRQQDIPQYGTTQCCINPNPLHGCNNTAPLDGKAGVKGILLSFGEIASGVSSDNILSANDIRNILKKNCLLIIKRYDTWSHTAHAWVIHGVNFMGDSVYVMCPFEGLFKESYSKLHGEIYLWQQTLTVQSCTRGYPCHCYNFEKDGDEDGPDCGGSCPDPCPPPPSVPTCDDCLKNQKEEVIDCGGPNCPPCEDVPEERTIEKNIQLRPEVMAYHKITTKGSITVESSKKVSFITEEEGVIILLPGFKAERGCTFTTQRKDLTGCGRACPAKLCLCAKIDPVCYRDWYAPPLCINDLLYAVKIEYEIYDKQGNPIYDSVINVTYNGRIALWDCRTGAIINQGTVTYNIFYTVYYCDSTMRNYKEEFVVVDNKSKSLPENPNDSIPSETFSSPSTNSITLPIEHTPPSFVIIPNPNPGTFQIETNFSLSDITNLKITNSLGATVYEVQNPTSNTIQLPTSVSGLHFVVAMLKTGTVLTQKMMVQR